MRDDIGIAAALLGPGIAMMGCAGLIPGLGGGGTVRIHNATQASAICKVQIGSRRNAEGHEQRIEPGQHADLTAPAPGPESSQLPVRIYACDSPTYMTQNLEVAQGKQHLVVVYDGLEPPKLEAPAGFARYDLRNSRDGSQLGNLPRWQDEKGVKADWVFFSLRSRCDHQLEYKYEPSTVTSQSISPPPKEGHQFWRSTGDYKEIDAHAKAPITIWLRDREKGTSDWIEAYQLQPGTAARLEVDPSCKKIGQRSDSDRFHGCYEWAYSSACQLTRAVSHEPPPGCPDGTPSVEGDMSRPCQVKTPKGLCTIRFARGTAGCDVR